MAARRCVMRTDWVKTMRQFSQRSRLIARVAAIAMVGGAALMTPHIARAQNLLDFLFGGLRRAAPQAAVPAMPYAAPEAYPAGPRPYRGGDSPDRGGEMSTGRTSAFCVRTCDGRFFPVQGRGTAGTDNLCRSFCPAAATKTFYGSAINHARSSDGQAYADLDNAFAYRDKLVDGCTCNGRDSVGLASIDISQDATLQKGDIVATSSGFVAADRDRDGGALAFTPIHNARSVTGQMRDQLAATKVTPNATAMADADSPSSDAIATISSTPRPAQTPRPPAN